jgi:hypothetical protein
VCAVHHGLAQAARNEHQPPVPASLQHHGLSVCSLSRTNGVGQRTTPSDHRGCQGSCPRRTAWSASTRGRSPRAPLGRCARQRPSQNPGTPGARSAHCSTRWVKLTLPHLAPSTSLRGKSAQFCKFDSRLQRAQSAQLCTKQSCMRCPDKHCLCNSHLWRCSAVVLCRNLVQSALHLDDVDLKNCAACSSPC